MEQSSYYQAAVPHITAPISVINPQFCVPYAVDLTITRKVMSISDGNFVVTDVTGNIMFKVKGSLLSLRDKRILLDAAGHPIVTLREKMMSAHDRWQVFRGDSTDSRNLVYTVKKSSLIQFKTSLDVFLANNTKESVCDFKIKGSWFDRSCVIYAGDSSTIVAQMHKKHTAQSILIGKDTFTVTIYPNIDHAFIVSLVVILNEINAEDKQD